MKIVICDDEHEVLEKVAQICKKSFLSKVTIYVSIGRKFVEKFIK